MKYLTKLILSNLPIGIIALAVAYSRSPARSFTTVPPVPIPYSGAILFFTLSASLGLLLTMGIRMMKNMAGFLILYEKDRNRLQEFNLDKKIRVGVEIINWPYTVFLLTIILGMAGTSTAFISTRLFGHEELLIPHFKRSTNRLNKPTKRLMRSRAEPTSKGFWPKR